MGRHAASGAPGWLRAPSREARRYVYRVGMAVGPVLILYGTLSSEEWAVWLGVLGAVVDLGTNVLADANVPPPEDTTEGE